MYARRSAGQTAITLIQEGARKGHSDRAIKVLRGVEEPDFLLFAEGFEIQSTMTDFAGNVIYNLIEVE